MEANKLEAEREKFNALTQEDAKRILAAAEDQVPAFRSCWYCNSAHEHLKEYDVMICFACGFYYLQGYPATVVAMRSNGEQVTPEQMQKFNTALEKAS